MSELQKIDDLTFECPAATDEIFLFENNAGHLFYVCGNKVLSGIENLTPLSGCFLRDASALFAGEVFRPAEGLVWHTAAINLPWDDAVAKFDRNGNLDVFGRYGSAARIALGRNADNV
jgi:hypothetical protein